MGRMGMQAAGAYIRVLRKHKKWSQAALGNKVGVTGNTIYRIERHDQEPEAATLGPLLMALGGRIEHFRQLLEDKQATKETGEALAMAYLSEQEQQQVAQMTDTDVEIFVRELQEAPQFIPALREALRALRSGGDTNQ
jgi:transcriptional regulator with XRE-family HTH domain